MVGFVRRFARPNELIPVIKLEGLDPSAVYLEQKTGICYDGDELMYAGVGNPRSSTRF